MFIRKKHYHRLLAETADLRGSVAKLAAEITALRNAEADVLFGFAQDIGELKESLGDYGELAEAQRKAYAEQVKRDIGFQNMMNY